MVSETKQVIERSEDNAPRRLPPPEREAPRLRQVGELGGLHLSGEYVFAHSLVDEVALMLKDNTLGVSGVDWFLAWSDLRAAIWLKFWDDQVLVPVQLADVWLSA